MVDCCSTRLLLYTPWWNGADALGKQASQQELPRSHLSAGEGAVCAPALGNGPGQACLDRGDVVIQVVPCWGPKHRDVSGAMSLRANRSLDEQEKKSRHVLPSHAASLAPRKPTQQQSLPHQVEQRSSQTPRCGDEQQRERDSWRSGFAA